MYRILLLIFIANSFLSCKAYDTLSIRQVFNFNAGDTFDYKITSTVMFSGGTQYSTNSFQRVLIIEKTLSPDSQSISYIRLLLFPAPHIDTIGYTTLDSSIISIDTPYLAYYGGQYQLQTGIDSNSFITNSSEWSTTDNGAEKTYTAGLGITYARRGYGNPYDGGGENDTSLIYYARGDSTGGTPYYNQPTGMENIKDDIGLNLFPNPVNSVAHLSINNHANESNLILADILGREVLRFTIFNSETILDVSGLPNGIYIWQLVAGEKLLTRMGKIVKE